MKPGELDKLTKDIIIKKNIKYNINIEGALMLLFNVLSKIYSIFSYCLSCVLYQIRGQLSNLNLKIMAYD